MERLTEKHYAKSDYYINCSGNCAADLKCEDCINLQTVINRLGSYEDTGLTPEQVPIQKWVPVTERLPIAEYEEHRRKWGTDPEFIVVISGAEESTTLFFGTDFKDRFCWYDEDTTYSVSHWMNWPMPPKE